MICSQQDPHHNSSLGVLYKRVLHLHLKNVSKQLCCIFLLLLQVTSDHQLLSIQPCVQMPAPGVQSTNSPASLQGRRSSRTGKPLRWVISEKYGGWSASVKLGVFDVTQISFQTRQGTKHRGNFYVTTCNCLENCVQWQPGRMCLARLFSLVLVHSDDLNDGIERACLLNLQGFLSWEELQTLQRTRCVELKIILTGGKNSPQKRGVSSMKAIQNTTFKRISCMIQDAAQLGRQQFWKRLVESESKMLHWQKERKCHTGIYKQQQQHLQDVKKSSSAQHW